MRLLAICLLAALAGSPARAAFEDLGAGARAPGLGGAFTALADDAYAIYYNPSGLAQLERPQVGAAYSKLYTGLSDGSGLDLSQLAYAHPLRSGRAGALGLGWQRFSLNDLYSEQTLHMSYSHKLFTRDSGERLLGGLSVKYLTHSFKKPAEATNACSGINCNQGIDPVLSGKNSKSAIDADLGFIYRFERRFQLGLAAHHLMRPDVGFSGPDKLPLNLRGGVSYKSLWMNLSGEVQLDKAPDGKSDKNLIMAAERYFPTLEHGQFGVRGSLGLGSRDWRQLTMGGSYRINKIQFDYAFLMPLGVFKGSDGTHRLAMTLHFGAPTAEDEISREILEKARQMREQKPPPAQTYGYEFQDNLRPHDLNDPQFAEIRRLVDQREFRQAHRRLLELTQGQPADPGVEKLAARLDAVAYPYPTITEPVERWEVALASSAGAFVYGRDRTAMLHGSYALSLNPSDMRLDKYLERIEKFAGIRAQRLAPDATRGFIDEQLYRVEAANNRRDYGMVQQLLRDVLELEPNHVMALERLGSAYFLTRRPAEALEAWQRALPLETNPSEITALKEYIRQAEEQTKTAKLPGGVSPAEPPAAPAPEAAPAPAAPTTAKGDPRDVSALYQKGVEYYARGEYLQATAMFMRILQIDPQNAQARKALDRIRAR